jgi:hypothetical protein
MLTLASFVGGLIVMALGVGQAKYDDAARQWLAFVIAALSVPGIPVVVNMLRPGVLATAIRVLGCALAIIAILVAMQVLYFQIYSESLVHVLREAWPPSLALRGIVSLSTPVAALLPRAALALAPWITFALLVTGVSAIRPVYGGSWRAHGAAAAAILVITLLLI